MGSRNEHCCLCGERRRPTHAPVESFSNSCRIVPVEGRRPLQEGRWEVSPQMVVNVQVYRNGGTAPGDTHICDGCIVVGLQEAKAFVDASLAAFSDTPAGRALLTDTQQGAET